MHLIEGDFARAERLLTRLARLAARELPARGARRAVAGRDRAARRMAQARVRRVARRRSPAVLLAQAELELDAGELDAAQVDARTARRAQARSSGRGRIARARRIALATTRRRSPRCCRGSGARHMAAQERDALAAEALRAELASPYLGDERLDEIWRDLAKDLRAAPPLIALRARALDRLGRGDEAERELRARAQEELAARPRARVRRGARRGRARSSSSRPRAGSRLIRRTRRCC